ncbi:MAG: ABC transporter ATP-binding protein [Chloroflexi bacterium]|nr:ABC transporter ATP-binding protein [Chloroflexota bacterium]
MGNGFVTTSVEPIIAIRDLHKIYHLAGEDIHAVNDVSLEVWEQYMTAIVGRSGSGKTTLLNLIAGLDRANDGEIMILGRKLATMNEQEILDMRLHEIGFVFQSFGLMPLLSAAENVSVPLRMRKMSAGERRDRVETALEWVGLADRARHRPYELSGGEQQRVAIARALAAGPRLVLADEPTGQLDTRTGRRILELLRRLVEDEGITVVIVSHDPQVMAEADIVHEMRDGMMMETRIKEGITTPDGMEGIVQHMEDADTAYKVTA